MHTKKVRLFTVAGIALALIIIGFIVSRPASSNNNQQSPAANTNPQTSEVLGKSDEQKEVQVMQPDINNEEFTLTGSTVSCSTTNVNGDVARSCSGNIRIVPLANNSMNPGLYKINEQTKLLHNGEEQDLNSLKELSQNQTTVRLTLASGSEEMLQEIRY